MRTLTLAAVLTVVAAFVLASTLLWPADEAASIERTAAPEQNEPGVPLLVARPRESEPATTAKLPRKPEIEQHATPVRHRQDGIVLAGRVIDEAGRPVAHARIRLGQSLAYPLQRLEARQKSPRGLDKRLRNALQEFDKSAREVRSNTEGEFVVRGKLPAQLSVHVSHPEHLDTWLDGVGIGESLVVVLEDFAYLEGVVVDDLTGRPVPLFGIRVLGRIDPVTPSDRRTRSQARIQVVELACDPRSRRGVHPMLLPATNWTHESVPTIEGQPAVPLRYQPIVKHEGGRFVVDRLRAGSYFLEVFSRTHAGMLAGPFRVTPRSGRSKLQIRLPRGQPLLGQVLDAHSGTGLKAAKVVLYRAAPGRGANKLGKRIATRETGPDGTFDFGHVTSGTYNVAAVAKHYSMRTELGIELRPIELERKLLFQLPRTSCLSGIVENLPDGVDAWVFALTRGIRRRVAVDRDGGYRFADLDAGGYVVQLVQRTAGAGLPPLLSERTLGNAPPTVVLRPGDSLRFDLDAAEGAPRTVTGRVELDGEPGAGLRVRIYQPVFADPGRFTKSGRRQSSSRRRSSFRRRSPSQRGRRRRAPSRRPVPARGAWRRTTTDEQGNFRIENIWPGAYRLELAVPVEPALSSPGRRRGFGTAIYREDILVLNRDDNRFEIDIETGSVQLVLHPGSEDQLHVWLSSNALPKSEPRTWRTHPSLRTARFVNGTATLGRVRVGRYRYAVMRDKQVVATGEIKVLRGDKTDKVTVRLDR